MGYVHYWCHRDYAAALHEYSIARAALPNDAEVIAAIGYVHRRQGIADRGVPEIRQAMVLDPRNSLLPREVANSYTALRRYAEADVAYARSLAIFPGDIEAQEQRATSMMFSGDMAAAERILAEIPADTNPQGSVSLIRYKLAMTQRQPDAALAAIAHSPDWLMTRWEHSLAPAELAAGRGVGAEGRCRRGPLCVSRGGKGITRLTRQRAAGCRCAELSGTGLCRARAKGGGVESGARCR